MWIFIKKKDSIFSYLKAAIFFLIISYPVSSYCQNSENSKATILNNRAEDVLKDSADLSIKYALQSFSLAKAQKDLVMQSKVLNTIAKAQKQKNNYDSALYYFNKSLDLRKTVGDKKYIAQSYTSIGLCYYSKGDFSKALEYYTLSKELKTQLHDTLGIAILLTNIANVYSQKGSHQMAIEHFQKALTIFSSLHYSQGIASCLNGCGLVSENMSNYNNALVYYKQGLCLAREIGNKNQESDLLNNIGNVYFTLQNYDSALVYYDDALKIRKLLNYNSGIASTLNNIGLIYKQKKDYNKSISFFQSAFKLNSEANNKFEEALNLNAIGTSYVALNNFSEGLNYINQSLLLAENNQYKNLLQLNYRTLATIYSNQKQFEKAYLYFKKAVEIKDTIESADIKKRINELQTKYETDKKERNIQMLSKQNEIQRLKLNRNRFLIFGIILFSFVSVLVVYLLFRQRRLRNEQNAIVLEQKLLRTQMNPHFIFNSLASIQSLVFEDDKLALGQYIADFASLMRLILENSREEIITLEKEVNTLRYYLELNKLRFENKFNYSIDIEENVNEDIVYLPPMLGQPFVENAIKHGIAKKEGDGLISVRFKQSGSKLIYEIEDNGIGREKAKQQAETENNKHVSMAISITRERIRNFNQRNKQKINFEIIDLKKDNEACGTLVKFEIPLNS